MKAAFGRSLVVLAHVLVAGSHVSSNVTCRRSSVRWKVASFATDFVEQRRFEWTLIAAVVWTRRRQCTCSRRCASWRLAGVLSSPPSTNPRRGCISSSTSCCCSAKGARRHSHLAPCKTALAASCIQGSAHFLRSGFISILWSVASESMPTSGGLSNKLKTVSNELQFGAIEGSRSL